MALLAGEHISDFICWSLVDILLERVGYYHDDSLLTEFFVVGSGKSSLMACMFRLVELSGGKIVVDGIDISTLGLDDLRSKIASE